MSVVAAIRRMLSDGLTIDQALIAAEAIESEVAPRRKAKPVQDEIEAEFEQHFWPIYPRRVGKGQALKAYRSARKTADLETIVVGVRRYAAARSGENPAYTKHASTWLNGQCWLDEPVPSRADPPPKPSTPRNAGEAAYLELQRNGTDDISPEFRQLLFGSDTVRDRREPDDAKIITLEAKRYAGF